MDININEVVQEKVKMTINLKGMGRFKVRLKLIVFLLRMIKWISPFPVIVNQTQEGEKGV